MTKTKIFTYDCFFNESIKIYVITTFQLTRVRAKRQGAMIGYNFVVDFDETVHDVRPPAARDRDKKNRLSVMDGRDSGQSFSHNLSNPIGLYVELVG